MSDEIAERIALIGPLQTGPHSPNGKKACVMEAVSFVAGEPWSDHPECACPVISTFLRVWNDGISDDTERDTLLRPLIPRLIGTRGDAELERRRSLMAADWLVRVYIPTWLRSAGLTAHADALALLPEITDIAQAPSIRDTIEAVRRDIKAARAAAWEAAKAAAGAAAWDDAWDDAWDTAYAAAHVAAGAAAYDAAHVAARAAACDAAWNAAWAAARDATGAAVYDAAGAAVYAAYDAAGSTKDTAGNALRKTCQELQQSALCLVDRMILEGRKQ